LETTPAAVLSEDRVAISEDGQVADKEISQNNSYNVFVTFAFTASVLWRRRRPLARWIGILFWRAVTLLSLAWLIFDRVYETGATIAPTGSAPKKSLYFPFAVSNNSHIFTLRNVRWSFHVLEAQFGGLAMQDIMFNVAGKIDEIAPGDVANVSCRRAIAGLPAPSKLTLRLNVEYDTKILGYEFSRRPSVLLTCAADASSLLG
jgi:hypothetical protein